MTEPQTKNPVPEDQDDDGDDYVAVCPITPELAWQIIPFDEWGSLPGWSSQKGAGREEFDAHMGAAVDRFAERPGPPECDVRTEGSTVSTGPYSWRYAAWRRGGNALVVGQTLEGLSYCQEQEAVVYIGALAEDAPFPEAAEFPDFLTS